MEALEGRCDRSGGDRYERATSHASRTRGAPTTSERLSSSLSLITCTALRRFAVQLNSHRSQGNQPRQGSVYPERLIVRLPFPGCRRLLVSTTAVSPVWDGAPVLLRRTADPSV